MSLDLYKSGLAGAEIRCLLRRVTTQELVQYSHSSFPVREVATTEEKDVSHSITWTFDYTADAVVNPVIADTRTISISYGFGSDAYELSSVVWCQ